MKTINKFLLNLTAANTLAPWPATFPAVLLACSYHQQPTLRHTDWQQLGWLLAWVLDAESSNYHARKFEHLPKALQESETLKSLLTDSEYIAVSVAEWVLHSLYTLFSECVCVHGYRASTETGGDC